MVLLTMLAAHSVCHGRALTKAEYIKHKAAIGILKEAIAFRRKSTERLFSSFQPGVAELI
ncbi:MAG: hypothetical protein ABI688_02775 [Bacteroidota bacterium]